LDDIDFLTELRRISNNRENIPLSEIYRHFRSIGFTDGLIKHNISFAKSSGKINIDSWNVKVSKAVMEMPVEHVQGEITKFCKGEK